MSADSTSRLHRPALDLNGDTLPPAISDAAAVPLLLTARQAAAALTISERTLWSLTRRGELPCLRIGRSVRYSRRDLFEYLDRLRAAQRNDRLS
jgi:excisionase family DNA binding protein